MPISALLDEREKRQAEKARAEALERQLAEARQRQAPATPPAPEEQLQAALYAQNLRTSRRFAERAYTPQLVATVHDWAAARCDEDPIFNQQMRASEDPYEAAVQAYRREQLLKEVSPDDLDDYKAWKAAKAAGGTGAAPNLAPAPAAPAPPLPPRSLATASGTGGAAAPHVNAGPGQAFAATLNR